MTDKELGLIIFALKQIALHHKEWSADYIYINETNEFRHKDEAEDKTEVVMPWFEMDN